MKKFFIGLSLLLLVLALIIAGFALYIQFTGIPKYPVEKIDLKVQSTAQRVARGRKLVNMLCADCHYDQQTHSLTGKRMLDLPPSFGTAYSANITQHPVKGIGNWTDGQIAWFLRTGIKPTGEYVPPYMVKLNDLSDEDMASMIAFLRSNDALVAAKDVDSVPCRPSFLVKFLSHVAFLPLPYPKAPIAHPDLKDEVKYGKYTALSVAKCYECHSADFKTNVALFPERSKGFMGGGNAMNDANGNTVYSANITPDTETGIGRWTEAQFARALRQGFRPDNTVIRYPMVLYPDLSNQEIHDLYSYFKTVPVIHHQVPPSTGVVMSDANASIGKKLYYNYSCDTCHGTTGNGSCDLTGSNKDYPDDKQLKGYIRNASNYFPDSKMPTWQGVIKEEEYGPLISYVRSLSAGKK